MWYSQLADVLFTFYALRNHPYLYFTPTPPSGNCQLMPSSVHTILHVPHSRQFSCETMMRVSSLGFGVYTFAGQTYRQTFSSQSRQIASSTVICVWSGSASNRVLYSLSSRVRLNSLFSTLFPHSVQKPVFSKNLVSMNIFILHYLRHPPETISEATADFSVNSYSLN